MADTASDQQALSDFLGSELAKVLRALSLIIFCRVVLLRGFVAMPVGFDFVIGLL
ncbi:hypothetical protein L195_g025355, partial [Trifolium pratense]